MPFFNAVMQFFLMSIQLGLRPQCSNAVFSLPNAEAQPPPALLSVKWLKTLTGGRSDWSAHVRQCP
jgi:hypothetical protein